VYVTENDRIRIMIM